VATWPVATVLPFLAEPGRFILLQPELIKASAARLAFELQYRATPNVLTYRKLEKLYRLLMDRLEPLGARDYMDVQSFLWVIEKYRDS
jgi:hypothetical protein